MAHLRFLKWLVTVLTATMILGVLTIVVLLVIRLQTPAVALPSEIVLPDGAVATAFTQGDGWFAVVTADDRILIFDQAGGSVVQEVVIGR